MKNQETTILIVIALIIGALVFYNYSTTFGIVVGGIQQPMTNEESWNGFYLKITSTYLGEAHSTNSDTSFCQETSDGDILLSNSYLNAQNFSMSSYVKQGEIETKNAVCGENYIYADVHLPPGKLVGSYYLLASAASSDNLPSDATLKINNLSIKALSNESTNKYTLLENSFIYDIPEEQDIKISLLTTKSYKGNAIAQVTFRYINQSACALGQTLCSDGICKSNCTNNSSNNQTNQTQNDTDDETFNCCLKRTTTDSYILSTYTWRSNCLNSEQFVSIASSGNILNTESKCEGETNTILLNESNQNSSIDEESDLTEKSNLGFIWIIAIILIIGGIVFWAAKK
jgi:hypothetical protein